MNAYITTKYDSDESSFSDCTVVYSGTTIFLVNGCTVSSPTVQNGKELGFQALLVNVFGAGQQSKRKF